MKVSLTGTLEGMKRDEAISLIESTGAQYSKGVTYETNYLVATKLDSNKAKRAREIGVEVITQSEFEDFIDAGNFPKNDLPERRQFNQQNNFPEFDWKHLPPETQEKRDLEYFDADGVITTRVVKFLAVAEYQNTKGIVRRYYRVVDLDDGERVKTLRADRILG